VVLFAGRIQLGSRFAHPEQKKNAPATCDSLRIFLVSLKLRNDFGDRYALWYFVTYRALYRVIEQYRAADVAAVND
jgi:hypothetical protein